MILTKQHIDRFEQFLQKIRGEVYPEPESPNHTMVTNQMISRLLNDFPIKKGKVLDVGCGQGVALKPFTEKGFSPTGITIGEEDYKACRKQGFNVFIMDQSFLDFDNETFDLIWCRHCLEHSFMPYYTLSEFYRVLKPNGYLYVEVPTPDSIFRHQENPNHYSILDLKMWVELMKKANFLVVDNSSISFTATHIGGIVTETTYWTFLCEKNRTFIREG